MESLRCRPPPFSSPHPRASSRVASKGRLSAPCAKARAELAQNSVVEADVGQLQAQQIFPVDPCADRIGGLPISQPLHELQERCERKPDRRLGGPSPGREQVSEVAIRDDPMQVVIETHDRITLWKDRPRDLRGLVWHHIRALHVK